MDIKLLNDQGQSSATFAAPDTVFGRDFNEALVHQIVIAFQANARSGNRAQKTRAEVHHSTKKPLPSKRYRPRSRWYDVLAFVAWGWSHISKFA